MRLTRLLATALLLLAAPSSAEVTGPITHLPALAGDYIAFESEVLERRMHIFVRLPEDYAENPGATYPVVYLLDGDSTFPMLAPQHLLLHYDEGLPEAIVVGIAYGSFAPEVNLRHIDFRPVLEDGSAGGSAAFLRFLEHELLPRIEGEWRADPARRVLFGQSRGGSFALYAAYERPGLFHGHIASNPGREWDTRLLYGMDREPPAGDGGGWLIVTSGSRDRDYLRGTALQWGKEIAGREGMPWRAELIDIAGGTHAAYAPDAYRQGMLRIFAPE